MEVYSQPIIEGCIAIPDFFIVNPRTGNGKLVEITLRSKDQGKGHTKRERGTYKRKLRQKEELENCGIPFLILTRENQKKIREYIWSDLF